jgi:peptidoglycan-associated lipoprotein
MDSSPYIGEVFDMDHTHMIGLGMRIKNLLVPGLAVALLISACAKDPPPPPAPTGPTAEEIAQQRATTAAAEAAAAEAARLKAEQETAERERVRRDRAIAEARSTLRELVSFDYDESAITDQAQQVLRRKIPILRDSPTVQIRLEGHADERGSTEYNLALGSRRAEGVRDFLSGFGISADRLTTTSFGEDRPLVSRSDENAWSRNRRVEFVITGGTIVP